MEDSRNVEHLNGNKRCNVRDILKRDKILVDTFKRWLYYYGVQITKKGNNKNESKPKFQLYLWTIFGLIALVHATVACYKLWDILDKRVQSLMEVNHHLLQVGFLLSALLQKDIIVKLYNVMEAPAHIYDLYISEDLTSELLQIKHNAINKFILIKDFMTYSLVFYWILNAILPILQTVYLLIFGDQNNDFITPWEQFYTINNIGMYFFISTAQSIIAGILNAASLGYLWMTSSTLIILSMEIKLFCFFVKTITNETTSEIESMERNLNLKMLLREVVKHHQNITRCVKEVNYALSTNLLCLMQTLCIHFAVSMYFVVETDEDSDSKWRQIFLLIASAFMCTGIYYPSQQLCNEGELLMRTLNECSWEDKPIWFKKSLCLMITYAGKPIEIRPANLFTLDLRNYLSVLRAAYSYFNIMQSLKIPHEHL